MFFYSTDDLRDENNERYRFRHMQLCAYIAFDIADKTQAAIAKASTLFFSALNKYKLIISHTLYEAGISWIEESKSNSYGGLGAVKCVKQYIMS